MRQHVSGLHSVPRLNNVLLEGHATLFAHSHRVTVSSHRPSAGAAGVLRGRRPEQSQEQRPRLDGEVCAARADLSLAQCILKPPEGIFQKFSGL